MPESPFPDRSESPDAPPLDHTADLQTILEAWHGATLRLEKTHETLRAEVERLRNELETKNRELARKNRLTDLGQMASHVAHEVRNNLVPVALYMSLLRRRLEGDYQNLDILEKIQTGITALDATVNDLLHFTSDREPRREAFDVHDLVDDVCTSLAPQLAAQEIRTTIAVAPEMNIHADRTMLRRALLNLVLNAVDAMPEGGELSLAARVDPDRLEIEVGDSGKGLQEPATPRLFEPFFTTKSTGTGLGLAIVDRVAEAHGGDVRAANRPQGGAVFTVRIPLQAKEAAA